MHVTNLLRNQARRRPRTSSWLAALEIGDAAGDLIVVVNFFEELKERVGN